MPWRHQHPHDVATYHRYDVAIATSMWRCGINITSCFDERPQELLVRSQDCYSRDVEVQQAGKVVLEVFQDDVKASSAFPIRSWGVLFVFVIVFLHMTRNTFSIVHDSAMQYLVPGTKLQNYKHVAGDSQLRYTCYAMNHKHVAETCCRRANI